MNLTVFLGFVLGVAAITMLLSRLALLLMRGWRGGKLKLIIAHGVSLTICCGAYVYQNPGAWLDWLFYAAFQGIWFAIDHRIGWGLPEQAEPDRTRVFD